MRGLASCLVVAAIACGGSRHAPPAAAPPAPSPAPADALDVANLTARLPRYIDSIGGGIEHRAFNGYVLVTQGERVLFGRGWGYANRATRQAPGPDTSFRAGSVTKQFTAAAILKLEQDGKLAVEDTVARHLPDFRGPARDVTIHQLLTHTAGVPSYTSDPAVLARKADQFTVDALLALFRDRPLEFSPGTSYTYSNSGYALLGAIIERASGTSYARYLEQALFRPAQMLRTEVGDAIGVRDRAEGYQLVAGRIEPADPIDMSLPYAAGAVRSTANDLARWHRALQGDAILGSAARAKLYRVERDHYAYGWLVQEIKTRRTVWHNGAIDGFHAVLWRIPDADVAVIAWSNVFGTDVDAIGRAAIEAVLGGTVEPVPQFPSGEIDPSVIARLVGTYELTDDARARLAAIKAPRQLVDSIVTIEITRSAGGIVMKPAGQSPVELGPQADGSFYQPDHDIRLSFELAGGDAASGVVLAQGKLALGYRRR
jgi:CubicO group peptidase (beta-lactamase class C family)